MTRPTAAQVQAFVADLLIIAILYLLVEFIRTEQEPVTDWATWFRGVGMGVLYRLAPVVLSVLAQMRAGTLFGSDEVIGDGKGRL